MLYIVKPMVPDLHFIEGEPPKEYAETELGAINPGAIVALDSSHTTLYTAQLAGSASFVFTNQREGIYTEVMLEWTVSTEGAEPTFTGATWPGGQPAWNTTLNAKNIAFFIVRASEILGES